MFVLAAIMVLTTSSMVDCHFFNMGPGLVYSIVLVFAENVVDDEALPKLFGRRKVVENAQQTVSE